MFSISKPHSHTERRPALAIATAILLLLNSFPFITMPSAMAQSRKVAPKATTTSATTAGPGTNVLIPAAGSPVTQNFDTLASTGTSSTVPADWAFVETLANANTVYTAGTGSGTGGDTYSFGAAASSERAFGTLQSGNLISTIGASYTNNVGAPITSLLISYNGEQWRLGATGRVDRLDFNTAQMQQA